MITLFCAKKFLLPDCGHLGVVNVSFTQESQMETR